MRQTPLIIEKLSVGYTVGSEKTVLLSDISVTLERGEFACLVGANGTGKSSLIRTIAGLQKQISGNTFLMGRNLAGLSRAKIADKMSVVLTGNVYQPELSVYDFVSLGRYAYTGWRGNLTADDRRAVSKALEFTQTTKFQKKTIGSLSDGERQLAMVALGLAQEPEIMILDEPTAYLDVHRRAHFTELMRQLAREADIAILCSTHDLGLALRTADTFWLITHSAAFFSGAPEDLALSGALDHIFDGQMLCFDHEACGFRTRQKYIGTATVQADGLVRLWTERVLTRMGYKLVEICDNQAKHVHVSGYRVSHSIYWIADINGQSHRVDSLKELNMVLTTV
ncbi:MAG: ABC transporter ATP-binding protein [Desulfobacterales bacterium]|nr:ABC transporter ATP-binding protein [Desulfobacterales bacterium]